MNFTVHKAHVKIKGMIMYVIKTGYIKYCKNTTNIDIFIYLPIIYCCY